MQKTIISILLSFLLINYGCQKKPKNNILEEKRAVELKNNIDSIIAIERNNTDSALNLYKKGLEDSKIEDFDLGINKYYKFIAFNLCIYQNKFNEANKIANQHLDFATKSNSNAFISDAYSSIALTFITRDIADSAAYFYLNAIEFAKKEKDSVRLNGIYRNIVKVYLVQKQYEKMTKLFFNEFGICQSKKRYK